MINDIKCNMKDKIEKILYNKLDGVYCDTCEYKVADSDEYGGNFHPCWECHKEQANWRLSYKFAEQLADKILNCIKEVEKQQLKERYEECLEVLDRGIDYYRGKE